MSGVLTVKRVKLLHSVAIHENGAARLEMDCDLMHFDYCTEQEEFFEVERRKMLSKKNFVPPLQIRKTVTYAPEPPVPLLYRRQESSEDHRVPNLSSLQRVPSFDDLSDDNSEWLQLLWHPGIYLDDTNIAENSRSQLSSFIAQATPGLANSEWFACWPSGMMEMS
ncbi:hypothetical protein DPMN_078561 [Dreissena polymorpha]|uniref:Uncharacterized protein n=1 Tax=Dreissena polymorpha TaxID=45954 RepID=A0A9D3YRF3_DREPO|nr:hypothetical protein DPMN_078561 [Dreissena polymorpha]